MGLEKHAQGAVADDGPRGPKRGLNLGGMVRVIVDHPDSPGFSSQLETPACPQEPGEGGSHLLAADAQLHARGPRRGRVEQIVLADDAQIHADGPRAVVESARRA